MICDFFIFLCCCKKKVTSQLCHSFFGDTRSDIIKNETNELRDNKFYISVLFVYFQLMAHNATVQLGGTAFLVCKVAGIDRVSINSNIDDLKVILN